MIMTNNKKMAQKIQQFRNHGMSTDYKTRYLHYYEMTDLGYNYRLTDIQCALGISQLSKIKYFIERRQHIAKIYTQSIENSDLKHFIKPLKYPKDCAYHIYVIKILKHDRDEVYKKMHQRNIGVNVHYKPIHLQPYYRNNYQTYIGQCFNAEKIYESILTLPIFPLMTDKDISYVLETLKEILL